MKCNKCGYDWSNSGDSAHVCGPVKVKQQEQGEPVALHAMAKRRVFDAIRGAYDLGYNDAKAINYKGRDVEKDHGDALIHALERYTTPQQRTWVGLTDDDRKNIHAMWVETDELTDEQDVVDFVEKLLKEKNT